MKSRASMNPDDRSADAASGHRQPRDFENRAVVETDLPLDVPPGERIGGGKCRVIEESLQAEAGI